MKKKIFFLSFITTLIVMILLLFIDYELQNGSKEYGIICFELAGNIDSSMMIIKEWTQNDLMVLAAFSLGFDYLYLFLYVIFLCLWTSVVADSFSKKSSKNISQIVILFFITAGLLDAIENYALLKLLKGSQDDYYSLLAYYCASIKFSLIALGLIYNMAITFGYFIRRR